MTGYKLCVYVPEDAAEAVKEALFAAGAGIQGCYRRCAFTCAGEGQFEPLPGSHPAIGAVGGLERVAEQRIEMLVAKDRAAAVCAALLAAHPYEEPAYDLTEIRHRADL